MKRLFCMAAIFLLCLAIGGANALQEAGKGKLRQGGETMTTSDTRPIVLLGASYAEGLGIAQLAGRDLINKGVGGEKSGDMLARFQTDVVALNPETVILWGFINDIFRGDRAKMASTTENIKENYAAMVTRAQEHGIVPVLATEITMSPRPGVKERVVGWVARVMGKTSYQDFINGHVMAVNHWIKGYAEQNGLKLLDFQALLAEGGVMRVMAYAQEDGSHISEEGYAVMAKYLEERF